MADFKRDHTGFYTIDLCLGESLNVLKRKWLKEKKISKEGYLICVNRLISFVKPSHTIHQINIDFEKALISEAQNMVKNYEIDLVDEIVVLKARNHRPFHPDQNLLITADKKMVKVAKSIKMPVWNCSK